MKQKKGQLAKTPHQDSYSKWRDQFSVAYMNNPKWRKTLTAIAESKLNLTRSKWKFIDSDYIYTYPIPRPSDVLATRLADGRFQPVAYQWIEWISFPGAYRPYEGVGYTVNQDIDGLVEVLTGCGQLYIERTPD